ncbi:MAG: hypothetical protein EBU87_10655 [Betaproteobacteria bacterium]|nr:hypothetical protein [Betaproteobacteria bacterium]
MPVYRVHLSLKLSGKLPILVILLPPLQIYPYHSFCRHAFGGLIMWILAVALAFVLIIAIFLWLTGAAQIPKEMRQSFSPQDLETLQSDLDFRKQAGQLTVVAVISAFLIWMIIY